MSKACRDRKSSETPRAENGHAARSLLMVVSLAIALVGCNIVQGFQEAGDTLFPEQSTHLAAPGLRLVSGGYQSLDVAAGTELFLLARRADDQKSPLSIMRFADPHPCDIPSVGAYRATNSANRRLPLFSYFHENVGQGTLHFADAGCHLYDLEFAEARLPIAETEASVVIWAGTDLWLATPEAGVQERVAEKVDDLIGNVLTDSYAVLADGRIGLFDRDWHEQAFFGDRVANVVRAGKTLFFSDSVGVHRIVSQAAAPGVSEELLAADACSPGTQDGIWVTFRAPCSGGPVMVVHEPTGRRYTLAFDANPQELRLAPARQSPGLDPTKDPFWFFGLRNGDPASPDTLVIKTPSGAEFTLGAHATLQHLQWRESAEETHGYALVDVDGESGRYLWWNTQGEMKTLAEHVLWRPSRLIVDFDGTLGKLAVTSGDRLQVLAERVPWPAFEYRDITGQWTALFHDLQLPGQNGQLSVFYGSLDTLQATPPDEPFVAPELLSIAPRAGVFRTSALNEVLSGVIYLADYDPQAGTGRLEYRNLELRFTALVNDGVSDYFASHDQVLYAIPHGDHAGIWLVSGK